MLIHRCIWPLSQCRGQGYDGASNMLGHLRGFATQLRKEEPTAIHVHCLAHCLNLCLQDAAKINKNVRDCLSLVMAINSLYSPERTFLFNNIKNEVSPDSQGLKPLCPTRWTVRTAAIESVVENYEPLTQAILKKSIAQAMMNTEPRQEEFWLNFIHLIFILSHLFSPTTEQLSCFLQTKDV